MSAVSAPPAGISIREFARREGCDDKLVRRAVTRGKIKQFPDGTLDPAAIGTGWRKANRTADTGADMSAPGGESVRTPADMSAPPVRAAAAPNVASVGARRTTVTPPEAALAEAAASLAATAETLGHIDGVDIIAQMLAGFWVSHAEAERLKENGLAFKHILAARREAGVLVEIEAAEQVLFETARAVRDAWLNWPARVAPLIAADLGLEADRMTEVLTDHVHQHLAELGEPQADFTAGDRSP
ncbi:hypothetical protein [Rhizosaccharibacter radicis]|uniref:Elements of external origin n=1 Tax=Rhizosaccharibacter radicis TaxID=2782605 RepID=A0ABT1VW15_9PROT|nr:hypothetical protein [Acetobacteraceae bacterium KSS12]